jgi:murein DD-endopeptidase MepM/ murein hydrolase activator NlpD
MWVLFRRRHARVVVGTVCVLGVATAGLAATSGYAAASVGSDQTDIARLRQEIAAQGQRVQALVSHFNAVQAHVNALDAQIAVDEGIVAADQTREVAATSVLRRVAITAYVSGTPANLPALAMLGGTSDLTTMFEQSRYLGAVNAKFDDALTTFQLEQSRTRDAQSGLQSEQAQETKTLRQLTSARDAATAAIAADDAKLSHTTGDLRSLLAASQQHEQQLAAERALAAARRAAPSPRPPLLPTPTTTIRPAFSAPVIAPTTTPTTVPPPTPVPSSSGYANPLRDVAALSSERIDQGVDYSGFGQIHAIGDGVVLSTVGPGWPGGTFIAYQLSDGPAKGLVVYAAEDIEASVQVGDTVSSNTVIGRMYAGPDGIETGWADGSALPDTMAMTYGQFNGTNSTAFGDNFSHFLQSLGAPGGVEVPPTNGTLPPSWPRW